MSNSPLVTYTKLSPNFTKGRTLEGKTYDIDTVTIHCIVGQWTAKQGCDYFAQTKRKASPNYVVGCDGSIGLSVEECNRSWCSGGSDKNGNPIYVNGISGKMNDYRAITIEVASDTTHPYAITDKALAALLSLLTDICQRNPGIGRLRWKGDKSLVGNVAEQNMTVHRWFAPKACPGDYLYERHAQIAQEVNARLDAAEAEKNEPVVDSTPADWEKPGVEFCTRNKIMVGDGKGDLMLHRPITRAEFCVMLERYHSQRENLV